MEQELKKIKQMILKLRGKDGCPWDQKQTITSLKSIVFGRLQSFFSSYEESKYDLMSEQFGELFFLLVFIAQISDEKRYFNPEKSLEKVSKKVFASHPHVFHKQKNWTAEEVALVWEKQKRFDKQPKQKQFNNRGEILDEALFLIEYISKYTSIFQQGKKISEDELGNSLVTLLGRAFSSEVNPKEALKKQIFGLKKRFFKEDLEKELETPDSIKRDP